MLASSASGMDEYAVTQLQELRAAASPPPTDQAWMTQHATAPGRLLHRHDHGAAGLSAAAGHDAQHAADRGADNNVIGIDGYWSVGPTSYRRTRRARSLLRLVHNPPSVWYTGGFRIVSMDDEDNQYRKVTVHPSGK